MSICDNPYAMRILADGYCARGDSVSRYISALMVRFRYESGDTKTDHDLAKRRLRMVFDYLQTTKIDEPIPSYKYLYDLTFFWAFLEAGEFCWACEALEDLVFHHSATAANIRAFILMLLYKYVVEAKQNVASEKE